MNWCGQMLGFVHLLIYFFMFVAIFLFNTYIIWIHIICSTTLLLHWITNDNNCILTELECYLRDVSKDSTLTNQLLSPLLGWVGTEDVADTEVIVLGTMFGLVISVCKLYWLCADTAIIQ